MRLYATAGLALVTVATPALVAQEAPPKPYDVFKNARDLISSGKLDLAADQLKAFLDAKPSDSEFQFIEARLGADVFLKLKRVVQWSENKTADAEAKKTVDAIIARSVEVSTKFAKDPARMAKFIRNLGATPAEQVFALDQLKLAGVDAVPPLLVTLRASNDLNLKAGILNALPQLPVSTVPAVLGAIDGMSDDLKVQLLRSILARKSSELLPLVDNAETNFLPYLWYHAGSKTPGLKANATAILENLSGGKTSVKPPEEVLTALAEPFIRRKGTYTSKNTATNTVTLWNWDATKQVVAPVVLPPADADEYFALRYLRWAVDVNPKYEPAQAAFLSVLTERSTERAKFGDLAKSDPAVYQLLAATPATTLTSLLTTALAEKRTGLAVGLLQAIGERTPKDSLGVLNKAMNYPDARVQFQAAIALLKRPGGATHGSSAKVVEILQRAIAGETDGSDAKTGKAIIADPDNARGSRISANLRELGYEPERVGSGRELLRRMSKTSDIDLILVDRHIANPLLGDVLGGLNSDPNTAGRPILLVASAEKNVPPPVEALLVRLAVLVAATETESYVVPAPYVFNPKFPDLDREKAKQDVLLAREGNLEGLATARLKRLTRLVEASDLPTNEFLGARLSLRLPQLTYAILNLEYGVTPGNAPKAAKHLVDYTDLIKLQTKFDGNIAKLGQTEGLMRVIEQMDTQLDAEGKKKADEFQSKLPLAELSLEPLTWRDQELITTLSKQHRGYKQVSVIAEPYSSVGLAEDVKQATGGDPAALPRSADEKKFTAKLAVQWLKKIATGEVAGYDAKPAEATLRSALRNDDLAPDAVEALARLGSSDTQGALVLLASAGTRPAPLRLAAANAALNHVGAFGKLTGESINSQLQAAVLAEKEPELKGKLVGLGQSLSVVAVNDVGSLIQTYPITPRLPAAPVAPVAPAPMPEEPKK
jgi:CheY-like chemotaxis protein